MSADQEARQSLEFLEKLRQAAPPNTAERLGQIMGLLENLAQENAYLTSLIAEEVPSETTVTAPPAPETISAQAPPEDADEPAQTVEMTLLTGINDGLRAPLVAIRGRAELIEAGLLGRITPEQKSWLHAIHENTDRAFGLLDTVQQIVALNQARTPLTGSPFVSADLLQEAFDRMHERAQDHQHNLTLHLPEVVPLAHGDFYQALIILTDLLDNAIRYTPTGGHIRLSVESLGSHVLFSVADNGIGLTPEEQQQIGQPFWRSHHRQVRQHFGNGLRLYLARQVLTLQQGELIIYGETGSGTTVSFTLPTPH